MSDIKARRQFIKSLLLAAVALPVFRLSRGVAADKKKEDAPLPAGANALSESDPVATAVGYKADVTKIDFAKYPLRKKPDAKNQLCKNCALFTEVNKGWGKCQMLTAGLVSAHGWCGSWSKKT